MGFKENLKNIRKEKKLSQKALGELIGKKEITIRNYESGKITPPIKVIEEIAMKLEVPIYQLLGSQEIAYKLWEVGIEKNSYADYIWEQLEKENNIENRKEKEKLSLKISQDIFNILKTDVKEYFKIYSGKNLTSEEIKKLHEDILKYTMFLLSELATQK